MKKILFALFVLAVFFPTYALARHHRVYIHKQPPVAAQQPATVPLVVIPPLAVFYDLARRTDCRGDVLGAGGAGFDAEPKTGNFLIPAIYRSECSAAPKGRKP